MASLAPEVLFSVASFPVTNTVINTLLVDSVIIGSIFALKNKIKEIPGVFQNIIEMVLVSFYDFVESVAGKNTPKIFPYVASFFIFILISNWSGLLPGVGTIGFWEEGEHHEKHLVPLIRNATSDLNVTFALALISLFATHMLGIKTVGIKDYLGRYFSWNPINMYVGLLEIVSEVTKVISLSFRLFGNIYAGEFVLLTISSLFAFGFPVPFMLLEIIVGLVQALVFSLLTMVFMSVIMTSHNAEAHTSKEVSH